VKLLKPLRKSVFKLLGKEEVTLFSLRDDKIVPVPKHAEIKRGLSIEIIAEAGLTKDEFMKLIKIK
jgi:hypothetical protein